MSIKKLLTQADIFKKLAIRRLAQDPIWYGKLDPSDPRNHDPLYGGDRDPNQPLSQAPPSTTNPNKGFKQGPVAKQQQLSGLPAGLVAALSNGVPSLKGQLYLTINPDGKSVDVQYNADTLGANKANEISSSLQRAMSAAGYKLNKAIGVNHANWAQDPNNKNRF